MKIYIAIWKDRHADTTAHPFSDKQKAIEWARANAKECAYSVEDYEEIEIDEWVFCADYSEEGDCIYIIESELDSDLSK